jgi:hypothetical protein
MNKAWIFELDDDGLPTGKPIEMKGIVGARILTDEEYRERVWNDYVRQMCERHGITTGGDDE